LELYENQVADFAGTMLAMSAGLTAHVPAVAVAVSCELVFLVAGSHDALPGVAKTRNSDFSRFGCGLVGYERASRVLLVSICRK
jgi:hypothetical protein